MSNSPVRAKEAVSYNEEVFDEIRKAMLEAGKRAQKSSEEEFYRRKLRRSLSS